MNKKDVLIMISVALVVAVIASLATVSLTGNAIFVKGAYNADNIQQVYTKAEIDNKFANVYTKAEADAKFGLIPPKTCSSANFTLSVSETKTVNIGSKNYTVTIMSIDSTSVILKFDYVATTPKLSKGTSYQIDSYTKVYIKSIIFQNYAGGVNQVTLSLTNC